MINNMLSNGIQTIITTTNLSYFDDELLENMLVVPYGPES